MSKRPGKKEMKHTTWFNSQELFKEGLMKHKRWWDIGWPAIARNSQKPLGLRGQGEEMPRERWIIEWDLTISIRSHGGMPGP